MGKSKTPPRKIFLWKNINLPALKEDAQQFAGDFTARFNSSTPINNLWQSFKDGCSNLVETHVPSKMSSVRFSQPWINRRVRRLSRRKKRAYQKARKTQSQPDIARFKRLQKETQTQCKTAHDSYVSDLVTGDTKTSKKLWTFVKGKRCDSSGISPLKKDGIAYSDPKIKATLLNEQFSSVFTKEDKATAPSLGKSPYPDVQAFDVHNNGVQKLLQNLNPHKASGPDNIPSRLLKETAAEIAPALTLLFQSSLQQGEVPEDWKLGNVTPLFKKGDKNDASNYRPISLTSACSKLLEHILHSQIMKHLENHTILTDKQHGFRKKNSCESQLILTVQDLAAGLRDGE